MKNLKSNLKRVFIVGSARSGTTLLQSILASHPEITSFPETHFFRGTIPKVPFTRIIKHYGKKDQLFIQSFLQKIGRMDVVDHIPSSTFSTLNWTRDIIHLLDELCLPSNQSFWVEKTPMHLYFIPLIETVAPNTQFIHIIRDGKDVVASLFEASQKHPESFGGPQSIQKCIFRWKVDLKFHKNQIGKTNHLFVHYKDIIHQTDLTLRTMCSFLNIDYLDEMKSFSGMTKQLKFQEETWKPDQSDTLKESNKFESIFSHDEQLQIKNQVEKIDLSIFNQFRN